MKGFFISLEGVEGSGKSTQIALLKEHLEERGHRVEVTREPGGTPISEAIRKILLDPSNDALHPTAEILLYASARAQHVYQRILPWLEAGAVVISDRFFDSTTAYQGAGRGMASVEIQRLHLLATGGLSPNLTILIDLPAEDGLARATRYRASDRIELESIEFHRRVRQGYLRLADEYPDRVRRVDGMQPLDAVAREIASTVDARLDTAGHPAK